CRAPSADDHAKSSAAHRRSRFGTFDVHLDEVQALSPGSLPWPRSRSAPCSASPVPGPPHRARHYAHEIAPARRIHRMVTLPGASSGGRASGHGRIDATSKDGASAAIAADANTNKATALRMMLLPPGLKPGKTAGRVPPRFARVTPAPPPGAWLHRTPAPQT